MQGRLQGKENVKTRVMNCKRLDKAATLLLPRGGSSG
jgi:hypothetical protein